MNSFNYLEAPLMVACHTIRVHCDYDTGCEFDESSGGRVGTELVVHAVTFPLFFERRRKQEKQKD